MKTPNCFVALGDSFSVGTGDPVEGFAQLGAIDWLAAALRQVNPGLQFTNLAKPGSLVSEIREQQLEIALALKPDFVTLNAGANDILKGRFNAANWEQEFQILFEALSQSGRVVVAGGIPNFPLIKTMKESHQVGLTKIILRANNVIQRLAGQYQVIFIDSWSMSGFSDQEDWSRDGVHLNSRGYFKFARETIQVLKQRTSIRLGMIESL
jgi:lysophospholipase L1-like esterase